MYVIFLFSIVASLLEGFGILMLLPLLESIGNLDNAKLNDNALSFF